MQRLHLIKFQEDLGKELGIATSPEVWENGLGTVDLTEELVRGHGTVALLAEWVKEHGIVGSQGE